MEDLDWLSFHMGLSCANSCYWRNSMFLGLKRESKRKCKRREFLSSLEDFSMSHSQIDPTSCLLHRKAMRALDDISWKCLLWWANSERRPASACASHVSHPRLCVRAFPRSTPVLEQNLSPDLKSIGFKEQLTLNRQMNDPHFLSLHLSKKISFPAITPLGCTAQEELTQTCSRAVKE